jgi:hypothetical protein
VVEEQASPQSKDYPLVVQVVPPLVLESFRSSLRVMQQHMLQQLQLGRGM